MQGTDNLSNKFYIKGFDGLRAISIAFVLLTHLGTYDALLLSSFGSKIWHTISGDVGVTLFFVISGFLITTLLLREKEKTGKLSYRNFIIRRFLRLLPPLILFYFIIVILMLYGSLDYKPLALIASIAYLYNFLPAKFGLTELTHTWSLAVEEQFYLLWPWVIYFFRKQGMVVIATCITVLALVAAAILPEIRVFYNNEMHLLSDAIKVQRFFLPAVAPIMLGCIFAVLNFYHNANFTTVCCHPITLIAAVCSMAGAFILPTTLYQYLLIFQSAGFAVLLSFLFNRPESIITRILEWQPLAFTGKISYSIYVWQGLFLRTGPGGTLWIQHFPQNILLTLFAALLSYFLIEKKVQKLKQHYT